MGRCSGRERSGSGRRGGAAVTYAFLSVDQAAPHVIARSPMERAARQAGARFAVKNGWNVAVAYPGAPGPVGWADASHLGKLELNGGHELELGTARGGRGGVGGPGAGGRGVGDGGIA